MNNHIMQFGGGAGATSVPYMGNDTDTDGNPLLYDVLYEYAFNVGDKRTTYRRLSPQENEYHTIRWGQWSTAPCTDAQAELWDAQALTDWYNSEARNRMS